MVGAPHHLFTYEEYLARERETGQKYEWLNGQLYAMSGGTPEHARLIAEVLIRLGGMVDRSRCRIFSSDLKVVVEPTGLATYPDVAIVCGDPVAPKIDPHAVINPKVLVEVLSPSTEAYDRGEKWSHFRRISSLEAYVLVGQIPQRIEAYCRLPGSNDFVHRVAGPGESLALDCLGGALAVDDLYRFALP